MTNGGHHDAGGVGKTGGDQPRPTPKQPGQGDGREGKEDSAPARSPATREVPSSR